MDFAFVNCGSIWLLTPQTLEANDWAEEHFAGGDAQLWGTSIVVEPRYVADIATGIQADGLTVEAV
jgi:hypothetical protein